MTNEGGNPVGRAIREAGLTVYDDLTDRPDLVYDIDDLETVLNARLVGLKWDYPIRTRSKVAKQSVADALGYPVPESFTKSHPRFPGQNLDISVQMSDNLQLWNEVPDPVRRYALIRVSPTGVVTRVRVVTGAVIALWDRTGTLTSKFQAKRKGTSTGSKLVSNWDTENFRTALDPGPMASAALSQIRPTTQPQPGQVLTIGLLHDRLQDVVGMQFDDPGVTQDRSRGVVVQQLVCSALGLGKYGDLGQFPDILSQALEVKLQLSPTIDLGLVEPTSPAPAEDLGHGLLHRDVRYAIVYGSRPGAGRIRLDAVVTSTGQDFFNEFQRFEGNVQNRKLQIPLPRDLFEAE